LYRIVFPKELTRLKNPNRTPPNHRLGILRLFLERLVAFSGTALQCVIVS